jgi:hypothetical protein
MNFLVFLTTDLMSPFVSRLMSPASVLPLPLRGFQEGFLPLIVGIIIAILLDRTMRESDSAGAVTVGRIAVLPRVE